MGEVDIRNHDYSIKLLLVLLVYDIKHLVEAVIQPSAAGVLERRPAVDVPCDWVSDRGLSSC